MTLMGLLVAIIVLGLVLYLVQMLPIEPKFKQIAMVIVIVIAIIWLLNMLGIFAGGDIRLTK